MTTRQNIIAVAGVIISLALSGLTFAYSFGVLSNRVEAQDRTISSISSHADKQDDIIKVLPAILNELQNVDRRLSNIEDTLKRK